MERLQGYSGNNDYEHATSGRKQARIDHHQLSPASDLDPLRLSIEPPTSPTHSGSVFSDVSSDGEDDIALFQHGLDVNTLKPADVDSLLARELTQLSMEDREKVYYDLHGVSGEVQETPELIQEGLQAFEAELTVLVSTDNIIQAYNTALAMNPQYVKDTAFRLRFLRAERFDGKMAAERYARYFEAKLDLFGPDYLVKDLVQDDLIEEDMKALYDGSAYDLPFRDRSGRLIAVQFAQPTNIPVRAILRKTFYGTMVFSEDEETQRKGCVVVSYIVGQQLPWYQIAQRQDMNRKWGNLITALPLRVEAMHLCSDSVLWRSIFAIFKFAATMFTRVRVREHFGSHKEVLFSLQTFGIPTQDFPVSLEDGKILTKPNVERWEKRRNLERMQQAAKQTNTGRVVQGDQPVRVGTPRRKDVLLGRGKSYYTHVGNVRLRNIVLERAHLYEGAGFTGKQEVSGDVVTLIKGSSGRFLKDDGAGWLEVEDETARKKVSHAFRTLRGLKSATNNDKGKRATASGTKSTKRNP